LSYASRKRDKLIRSLAKINLFFQDLKAPFPEKTNTVFYRVTNVLFML